MPLILSNRFRPVEDQRVCVMYVSVKHRYPTENLGPKGHSDTDQPLLTVRD